VYHVVLTYIVRLRRIGFRSSGLPGYEALKATNGNADLFNKLDWKSFCSFCSVCRCMHVCTLRTEQAACP
jgi:hypothetical protein